MPQQDDLLLLFQQLPFIQRLKVACVCSSWRQAIICQPTRGLHCKINMSIETQFNWFYGLHHPLRVLSRQTAQTKAATNKQEEELQARQLKRISICLPSRHRAVHLLQNQTLKWLRVLILEP